MKVVMFFLDYIYFLSPFLFFFCFCNWCCEYFFNYNVDRYKLKEEVIGRGANSLVTLATEVTTRKDYAVKVIIVS